jgi:hypothetical protein
MVMVRRSNEYLHFRCRPYRTFFFSSELDFIEEVSYVSTFGGVLLEYFEGKELRGITAVKGVINPFVETRSNIILKLP